MRPKWVCLLGGAVALVLVSCTPGGSILDALLGTATAQSDTLEWNKQIAVAAAHTAAVGLGGSIETLGSTPDPQAVIGLIRAFVHPVRFYADQSGYFYVYDKNCVNVAHATQRNLEGQSLYNYQDSQGKYVIRELLQVAQNGGGFVEYYWNNPNTQQEQKKIGYVEMIPGTDYFIGDGVYLE